MARRTPQRRYKLRAFTLLPALALAATAAGCAEEVKTAGNTQAGDKVELMNEGQLTVCTHLPYEPFQFKQGGKIVGFDVDLIDLVAKDLGVKQQLVDTSFEGIETGQAFETGKCDLAAAAITITPERDRVMDFSKGYFDADQALLVPSDSKVGSLDDLDGKVLGVQQGTTGEEYATKHAEEHGYETRQYEDLELLQQGVQNGAVQAGINDNSVLMYATKSKKDLQVSAEFDTGEQYGFAVADGNGALKAKIDEVIDASKQDGSYDEIYKKWFGEAPSDSGGGEGADDSSR
ncbi:ABC transporter substrate-binding protein [Prauserella rugosa]|uniref:Polar amino acid transport system substrate-binding protein n=1 Tax=Prauserella rugosa TaxID=43354 RepID=A0A660CGM6_9PSEU|nr:ABC transporter substrate-binding protein [Prauserella rugosa]KMS68172.1 ABC transporter substrate-binding protein [Streptomyces regensis]TWH21574.1 polar amino acid transport system substrate-binding protein [Prauserella rugosa]